jgi:hypothetical protein
MRLFEKGEISFIFLWVLNPVVILFYQNCAPSQLGVASTASPGPKVLLPADHFDWGSRSPASAATLACSFRHQFCPQE